MGYRQRRYGEAEEARKARGKGGGAPGRREAGVASRNRVYLGFFLPVAYPPQPKAALAYPPQLTPRQKVNLKHWFCVLFFAERGGVRPGSGEASLAMAFL